MSSGAKPVTFNRYGPLINSTADGHDLYAADHPIQLTEQYAHPRHASQLAGIAEAGVALPADPAAAALFGPDALGWAYKVFEWADWTVDGSADAPPVACVTAEARQSQLNLAAEPTARRRLLLFNVIVAAEWAPDAAYRWLLQWAFRRASDFLYDATDGLMAFGQVVIGGPELLPCADIHIMASNRLHPRSWVGGLLKEAKYQPVRVGRGLWHDRNHLALPWNEPEGYRTLIHEWCHYALSLMDGYIERRRTAEGEDVVVPTIQLTGASIMESLDGTSELFSQAGVRGPGVRHDAWSVIAEEFPQLILAGELPPPALNGPGRLPLPLPILRGTATAPAPAALLPVSAELIALLTDAMHSVPMVAEFFRGGQLDRRRALSGRVWVHLLRHDDAGAIVDVLAQGTLDARALEEPFPLLGARPGDTVHLTYESPLGAPVICTAELQDDGATLVPGPWRTLSSHHRLAEVVPVVGAAPDALQVRITLQGKERPVSGLLTQQGDERPPIPLTSDPVSIQRLDGHLLLRWEDEGITIGAYSHGGGPPTHSGISPGMDGVSVLGGAESSVPVSNIKTPITAGSSDGKVMIFFEPFPLESDPAAALAQQRYYQSVRVVTTALYGVELPPPWPDYMPASGLYSLAASRPLPADLNPTLVVNLDPVEIEPGRRARVYLWQNGNWHAMETSAASACRRYVYLPLRGTTLVGAIADYTSALAGGDDPRVTALRLYWEPAV